MENGYKPFECIMTNSSCYKGTRKFSPKGVLWHSTGANNWWIKRYVQPLKTDDNYQEKIDKLGKNTSGTDWNHVDKNAGVNAFIGKFQDGTVGACQALPWDYRPWGCGSGSKGSWNDTHVQFEICEQFLVKNSRGQLVHYKDTKGDKEYAQLVWDAAVEFTAYICEMYNLDPLGTFKYKGMDVPVITDHHESWEYGCGSGHGDIDHWFPIVLGKNMEDARREVYELMTAHKEKGWKKEDGKWYYYKYGKKVTGWQVIDDVKYYFDKDGVMQTGWIVDGKDKYYCKTNGAVATEWQKVEDKWYYFSADGVMYSSDWIKDGKWYYVGDDGAMVTGWLDYNGHRYYLDASGAMVTGWKRVGREWYYFVGSGVMVTGWRRIGEDEIGYFFYQDGHMAKNEWINGLWFDNNGAQVYQYKGEWKSNDKGKWWEDELGWYPKNQEQKIDSVVYKFDAKGYLIEPNK